MSDLPLDYSKPVYVSGNIWACFFTDWNRSECKVQRCFLWGEGQEAGEVCEAEGESALSFLFTYVTIKKILLSFSPCCQMERYGKTPSSHCMPSFSLRNRSQRETAVSIQVCNSHFRKINSILFFVLLWYSRHDWLAVKKQVFVLRVMFVHNFTIFTHSVLLPRGLFHTVLTIGVTAWKWLWFFRQTQYLMVLTDVIAEVKRESAYKMHPVIIQGSPVLTESGDWHQNCTSNQHSYSSMTLGGACYNGFGAPLAVDRFLSVYESWQRVKDDYISYYLLGWLTVITQLCNSCLSLKCWL